MSRIRVAIIDGSIQFVSFLNNLLNTIKGFDCVGSASDGESGLNLIRKTDPQLLIVDNTLPGIDGLTMLRRTPSLGLKSLPSVLLTPTFYNDAIGYEAISLGVSYFLPKPVNREVLRARLIRFRDTGSFALLGGPIQKKSSISKYIISVLLQARFSAELKGFRLMFEAVSMALQNPDCLTAVTKRLYPALAKSSITTPACVERNLRHAITTSWSQCPPSVKFDIFGHDDAEPPSNSAYIAAMTLYVSSKLGEEGNVNEV
ncbi:MAG: sporulation initiation factor Spo0A C-terminal domain-containing protein [Oscillospiraceae bacterium]|jgi:two-component system response regulator (stage 0 sporulation protein A)